MASLRRHPKSQYWIACFRDSNGRRTTRSTKTTHRPDALKMVVEWECAARKAAAGRLTEAQARSVINSILEHAGEEAITYYKVRDWLTEWLSDKTRARQSATAEKYRPIIERFLKHIGKKADGGLANLKVSDIRSFRDLLHDEGRAASTVNQNVAKILSAPLAKAVRLGYAPTNPCAAIEPLAETPSEAETFTFSQVESLLKAAPTTDWKGMILAGYYTGQRLSDLATLPWSQVDLAKEIIFIRSQRKTSVGVAIPIHPDLLEHLLTAPTPDQPDAPVFPSLATKTGSGKSGLSETFKRIMVSAGIPLEKRLEALGNAGRGRNKLSFHGLRHSFNSELANAGVPEEVRQKLTGHRDKKSNQIYTHLDFPTLKAAVHLVPSIQKRRGTASKKISKSEEAGGGAAA